MTRAITDDRTIMHHFFLSCLALALFYSIAPALAQQSIDIKEIVQDKTLWSEHFPERYYFGGDGTFLLQYMSGKEPYETGAVRDGTWSIGESNRLCWTLKDEGIDRCYDLSEKQFAQRPWHAYDNVYELKEVGRPANILWNRWMHGNLITKPEIYQAILNGKMPPLDEDAYKAAITGKIMRLPLNYVYHRADGSAFWMDEKSAKKIEKNPSLVEKGYEKDSWTVESDVQCYLADDKESMSCMIVFSAQDLYVPQEGWVQILPDNFIRLIKPSDLIPVK